MRYCLCHVFHRGMFGMWYRHKTTTPLYSYVVIIFVWVSHGWHFFVTLYGWWVIWYPSGHVLCVVLVTLAGMAIHVFPIFGWLTCGRLATLFFFVGGIACRGARWYCMFPYMFLLIGPLWFLYGFAKFGLLPLQAVACGCRAWPYGVRWCCFPIWPRSISCCNGFDYFTGLVLVGCPGG